MSFITQNGKTISLVVVERSPRPVFMKSKGKSEFYARMGNSCQLLDVEEATAYIKDHFNGK